VSSVQWGTVGEWASGVGTVAAVLAALWVARREGRWRRADLMQRARSEAAKLTPAARESFGDHMIMVLGHFKLTNNSDLSTFRDVKVTGVFADGQTDVAPLIPVLRPRQSATTSLVAIDREDRWVADETGGRSLIPYVGFTFEFRDETGHTWATYSDEVLLRVRRWLILHRWLRSDGRSFTTPGDALVEAVDTAHDKESDGVA